MIEPRSPALQANSLPAEPPGKPKNTGVGSLCFLQRIFLTQESNWGLPHCRRILYQLSWGKPQVFWSESYSVVSNYMVHEILQARILEWVAFPFSRGSFRPRDWTQVSHIAGRFFTSWATREAPKYHRWFLLSKYLISSVVSIKCLNFFSQRSEF